MQVLAKIKIFFKDHWHLVFKDAANNYLRLRQCQTDENGDVTCAVSFSSYSELKRYQKKLRRVTVSLASAIAMVMVAVVVSPYVMNPNRSSASSFIFTQNNWSGSAGSATTTQKTGWTGYFSKDTNINNAADASGDHGANSLTLAQPAPATTGDANFTSATVPSGMYLADASGNYSVSGTALALKKVSGATCTVTEECVSGKICDGTSYCVVPPLCSETTICGNYCTYGGQIYGTVYISNTTPSQCWLDRNLGAKEVAIAKASNPCGNYDYCDQDSYGWLFQWGRKADGHQYTAWGSQVSPALSGTRTTLSTTDTPGHADFIRPSANPFDWRSPQNGNLWASTAGYINNPCPTGWHVPTGGLSGEWDKVRAALGITNYTTAASSALRLPAAGHRPYTDSAATPTNQGIYGHYWAGNYYGSQSWKMTLSSTSIDANAIGIRASGFSVRCIKN
jgi:uncharacterized protein (TIGR02145 family)